MREMREERERQYNEKKRERLDMREMQHRKRYSSALSVTLTINRVKSYFLFCDQSPLPICPALIGLAKMRAEPPFPQFPKK